MPTIQQRAQAAFNALIQNITATVVAGSYARVAAIPLLSHYTSVEAFASIRRSGQFWFSNIPDMAAIDTSEVIEGTQIVSDALRTVGPQVIRTIPHAQMNAGFLFEQMKTPVLTETYAISLCEHGSDQQTDRLTMWHVYGHKGHGLCLVLLQLYLAPSAPLLRMSDVGLVRVGKVGIHVAIVATAGSRRQTLFIGIEAAVPRRSYVTLPLDAERIVSGEDRSRCHPDGCHGDKSGDRQEQFTHHSLLDGSPPRNGTPPSRPIQSD